MPVKSLHRLDPTRTGQLRRNFARQIKRKFRRIKGDLLKWLVVQDSLGMRQTIVTNAPNSFKFATSQAKLAEFKRWLRERFKGQLTGRTDAELWERFIRDGFNRGAGRAFDDSRAAEKAAGFQSPDSFDGGRREFLRSAFGRPETREKVELLSSRSFEDLVNVTEDMTTKMGRVLADGLVRGVNPREMARELDDELDIGYRRAEIIARTEIIRAHAEGQLDAFDRLGVEEIGVMVEWSTAGDDRVCEQCASMGGVVLRVEEAHGLIPAHPQCRCAFVPANVGEDDDEQVRGKTAIESAFQSARDARGLDKDEFGPDVEISRKRPESLIGNRELNEFSRLLTANNDFFRECERDDKGRCTSSEGGLTPQYKKGDVAVIRSRPGVGIYDREHRYVPDGTLIEVERVDKGQGWDKKTKQRLVHVIGRTDDGRRVEVYAHELANNSVLVDVTNVSYFAECERDERGWCAPGTGETVECGNDIRLAAEMLAKGAKVTLDQTNQVSTLVDEMRHMVQTAIEEDKIPPKFDLCKVSAEGTNLFCQDNIGVPRVQMPQMRGIPVKGSEADELPRNKAGKVDVGTKFIEHLEKKGYAVEEKDIRASHLRASQNEIDGARVVQLVTEKDKDELRKHPIFVTKDNYVVDGHHHWAALIAKGSEKDKDYKVPVYVIDTDIGTALHEANAYAKKVGIAPKSTPSSTK